MSFVQILNGSILTALILAAVSGCTRTHYRMRADQDAHCVLQQKTANQPWQPASDYSLYPSPASRLHDPTPTDDPCLPVPAPQLYAYDLPAIPKRDPSRFKQDGGSAENTEPDSNGTPTSATAPTDELGLLDDTSREHDAAANPTMPSDSNNTNGQSLLKPTAPQNDTWEPTPSVPGIDASDIPPIPKDFLDPRGASNSSDSHRGNERNASQTKTVSKSKTKTVSTSNAKLDSESNSKSLVRLTSFQDNEPGVGLIPPSNGNGQPTLIPVEPPTPSRRDGDGLGLDDSVENQTGTGEQNSGSPEDPAEDNRASSEESGMQGFGDIESITRPKVKIPQRYWESVPANCLRRMLEFKSIVDEYEASFDREPSKNQLDPSPRLALEDIIDLAMLNSRELQTEKESLYRASLGLTLERFDYQLKPSFGNNGSAANFRHNRSQGETVNTLGIPTTFQLERALWTGGDFLARFANSVLLTFNGPQGFTADVGSELLFEFTQSIFQRDIRLESLTQAERNVVYAARDYARFRRELFVTLASQYYSLIRQYRQIEIDSQNYFTLVRNFDQGAAEFRAGLTSRIELDQIEQQVINGRRGLLSSCTNLDNALDDLKIRIGLPTEQAVNVDLTELTLLTLRDEIAVNGELIDRAQARLQSELQSEFPARATLRSASIVLLERLLSAIQLRESFAGEDNEEDTNLLQELHTKLQVEASRLDVEESIIELESELNDASPSQILVLQRRKDVITELLRLVAFQIEYAERNDGAKDDLDRWLRRFVELRDSSIEQNLRFELLVAEERLDELPNLLSQVEDLQTSVGDFVSSLDRELDIVQTDDSEQQKRQAAIEDARDIISNTAGLVTTTDGGGLVPVTIDMDEAMMTALVQRFDLINERGFVADDWRQIKYAADDLKSILNLRASQSIRTRSGENRPFDFTFDDSSTAVSATLDLPFNRRAQRNVFRVSLINYQASLRRLMQLEDNVKLSVRRDLRSLDLDREQYVNDIASAALANERVISTELELRLGVGNVAARDFLESQNAYIGALSNVASRHIDYITGRLQLFLDLESLTVGDDGFWDKLYIEEHQPEPFFQLRDYALPAYGHLHPCLKYSNEIRRMLCVPTGTSMIRRDTLDDGEPTIDPISGDLVYETP